MSKDLQISARTWTGLGPVQRLLIETDGEQITRILRDGAPIRSDGLVYPDSALLIPGLHDAHCHPLFGGLQLANVYFAGVSSREEFFDRLRDHAAGRQGDASPWIEGSGLDETRVQISRTDIDTVCPDIPVFIWSHDLHTAFVNSPALIRARIEGRVHDLEGGRFERDSSGVLNGVLRETAAHLVRRFIPPPSAAQARRALIRAQELAFSLGITAVGGSARKEEIPHYLDFAQSSDQKLRINLWRVSDHFNFESDRFEQTSGERFRYAALKGFVDGALGSLTAAMWEPYDNDPSNSGVAGVSEGPLARWIRAAHSAGFQIALHAIGDRANSICLDAIEMAGSGGRGPEYRPRVEHAQILRLRDIPRFTELGAIASMQPIHCIADMGFVEARIGGDRVKGAYAWKSLLNHNVVLVFGSDWPVETLDPIAGIHAAVTRQDYSHQPEGGWQPQEKISVAEALKAYTGAAAYAAFWDDSMGTIEPGKLADFTVLSQDLLSIPPEEIPKTRVLSTIVGGEVVYRSPDDPNSS